MMERLCKMGEYSSRIHQVTHISLPQDKDCLVVCDSHTRRFVPPEAAHVVELSPGERFKTSDSVHEIIAAAINCGLARDGVMIGIGGGVITDITAFAASAYMRGTGLILYPTTLLSMVDAAIGGKTGYDFMGYKNLIGSFYPASEVRICIDTLETLPEREYLCGLAEIIKAALLGDAGLLSLLEDRRDAILRRDTEILSEIVWKSITVKCSYVEADLRESGIRAHLNLGHTFGHSLETASGFERFSHGEGVAWGMDRSLETGLLMGLTDPDYAHRVRKLLRSYHYFLGNPGIDAELMKKAISGDKKKAGKQIRFVIQRNLMDTILSPVPADILDRVLRCQGARDEDSQGRL